MTVKELMNELKWMLEHTACSEDTPVLFGLSYPHYGNELTHIEYDCDEDSIYEDWVLLYSDDKIIKHRNSNIKNNE